MHTVDATRATVDGYSTKETFNVLTVLERLFKVDKEKKENLSNGILELLFIFQLQLKKHKVI